MTASLHKFPSKRPTCPTCGTEAACDCAYSPPHVRAAAAVAENPDATVRAIAEKAHVSVSTAYQAKQDVRNRTVANPVVQPIVALTDDFLNPADADRTIRTIAQYLNGALLDPPPGVRACLADAMGRASPNSLKAINTAADFLSFLRSSVK